MKKFGFIFALFLALVAGQSTQLGNGLNEYIGLIQEGTSGITGSNSLLGLGNNNGFLSGNSGFMGLGGNGGFLGGNSGFMDSGRNNELIQPAFNIACRNQRLLLYSLSRALETTNLQDLQQYLADASNPDLNKGQLIAAFAQINQQNPQLGQRLIRALERESEQLNQFLIQIQQLPQLEQIIDEIINIHLNQNVGLGQDILQLLNLLLTLPTNIQYIICELAQETTQNTPQLTPSGLAALSATCQIIKSTPTSARISGLRGVTTGFGNSIGGPINNLGSTMGGLTGRLSLGGPMGNFGGLTSGLLGRSRWGMGGSNGLFESGLLGLGGSGSLLRTGLFGNTRGILGNEFQG